MNGADYEPVGEGSVKLQVEQTLVDAEAALVVVALESDNTEGQRLLANVHAYLARLDPELLARAITMLLAGRAGEAAEELLTEFEADFTHECGRTVALPGLARRPAGARGVASVPARCPDPAGHQREWRASETTWRERRAGKAVLRVGVCPWCGGRTTP